MIKSLNTAASGMQAQQTSMDVIANNIANVSTNGYKKARAEFEDLLYQTVREPGSQTGLNAQSPTGVQVGLGVKTSGVQRDFEIGSAKITRNPLDLQIEGSGFFPIQLSDGQVGYTRDGAFKKDSAGKIVDRNGHSLLPEITVPANALAVDIAGNGMVSITLAGNLQPQPIGQVELVQFVNPAGLKSVGKNIFMPTLASGTPNQGMPGTSGLGEIAQGQIEASNVNIADEMVNMIMTQRSYETNSKVMQAADQMLQAINAIR